MLSTSALADTQVKKHYPMDSDNIKNLIPSIVDESVSDRSASYQNRARARGIYFFEVMAVRSPQSGYENIDPSTSTTGNNHGGSFLHVYVFQAGYGSADYATLNGVRKSPVKTWDLCGSDFHDCTTGETITGYVYGFDFSGQQYGYFSVSAYSSASPFGSWSDSLYIR